MGENLFLLFSEKGSTLKMAESVHVSCAYVVMIGI